MSLHSVFMLCDGRPAVYDESVLPQRGWVWSPEFSIFSGFSQMGQNSRDRYLALCDVPHRRGVSLLVAFLDPDGGSLC